MGFRGLFPSFSEAKCGFYLTPVVRQTPRMVMLGQVLQGGPACPSLSTAVPVTNVINISLRWRLQ